MGFFKLLDAEAQVESFVKKELHKLDPELAKHAAAIVAGLHSLELLFSKYNEADYLKGVTYVNNMAGQRLSDIEVRAVAKGLGGLAGALKTIAAAIEAGEKELETE